ncbi:MAG: A24 family peptidase [Candidatus Nanoarchaeia archaeon]|nr:A24 family peptidase [Candidatus Nanoarchaeia archaeon]MDD5358492.1 A24 family peptidase [Candidatus Nanoarchaeia archaeon]MDD5589006.1 A24 family peptidase [Candidatus Nanoarchaeia archaeon]
MYEVIFLWLLSLSFILVAVVQDLKTREIDNWISFSLVIFALGFRFLYSLFQGDFEFFYSGAIGFGVFFALGNILYYSRVFAGGDAKLMIGLGAILAPAEISSIFSTFFNFVLIFLTVGFVYTIATSIVLCAKRFKPFKKEFARLLRKHKKIMCILILLSFIFLIIGFFEQLFLILGVMTFVTSYLYIYSKAVDEACIIKRIEAKNLREGDWIYSDLKVGKKVIKATWDGVTRNDIREIIKKFKQVRIREGIPFSPVFFFSFIIFILFEILKISLWNSFWQP